MDKKIKILFAINKLGIGGAETVVVRQINNIDKTKFDVYLGLLYATDKKITLYDQLEIGREKIVHFGYASLFDFKAFRRTARFLKDNKIDAVIANLFEANTALRLAAILSRVKIIIITEHSCYFNKSLWQKIIDHILAYFTDIIFAVSAGVAEFTSKQEKINLKKIKILKQISDLKIKGIFKRDDLRKRLDIPRDASVAATIGRFSPEKAQYRIIDLADLIVNKRKNNKIYFAIVGYGALENELRENIKNKNLEKFVKIIVDPKNAKEYLAAADIFILTSDREGLPIAMLEAMAAGLPCAAFDVGGVKDILRDGENGRLVKLGDTDLMAGKIISLLEDSDELRRMGESAIKTAEENSGDIKELENLLGHLILVKAGKKASNLKNIKNYSYGFIFPFFLKKSWFWFADPFDVKKTAMANFFSYNKVDAEGFRRKDGLTSIIDLRQDLDAIYSKMRNNFIIKQIKKGERNGVIVKRDNNFREFKKIYNIFRKSKNLLKDNFAVFEKNCLLFSAYYDNKMIAGGIFVSDNRNIRALVLASLRNQSQAREREIIGQANRMVIWEAIKYAKNTGHELFDLGGISPETKDKGEISLAEFKESFGGERKECYYYHKVYSKLLKRWIKIRLIAIARFCHSRESGNPGVSA
ncbi:MAG: glycosyltransferase [bacterium]